MLEPLPWYNNLPINEVFEILESYKESDSESPNDLCVPSLQWLETRYDLFLSRFKSSFKRIIQSCICRMSTADYCSLKESYEEIEEVLETHRNIQPSEMYSLEDLNNLYDLVNDFITQARSALKIPSEFQSLQDFHASTKKNLKTWTYFHKVKFLIGIMSQSKHTVDIHTGMCNLKLKTVNGLEIVPKAADQFSSLDTSAITTVLNLWIQICKLMDTYFELMRRNKISCETTTTIDYFNRILKRSFHDLNYYIHEYISVIFRGSFIPCLQFIFYLNNIRFCNALKIGDIRWAIYYDDILVQTKGLCHTLYDQFSSHPSYQLHDLQDLVYHGTKFIQEISNTRMQEADHRFYDSVRDEIHTKPGNKDNLILLTNQFESIKEDCIRMQIVFSSDPYQGREDLKDNIKNRYNKFKGFVRNYRFMNSSTFIQCGNMLLQNSELGMDCIGNEWNITSFKRPVLIKCYQERRLEVIAAIKIRELLVTEYNFQNVWSKHNILNSEVIGLLQRLYHFQASVIKSMEQDVKSGYNPLPSELLDKYQYLVDKIRPVFNYKIRAVTNVLDTMNIAFQSFIKMDLRLESESYPKCLNIRSLRPRGYKEWVKEEIPQDLNIKEVKYKYLQSFYEGLIVKPEQMRSNVVQKISDSQKEYNSESSSKSSAEGEYRIPNTKPSQSASDCGILLNKAKLKSTVVPDSCSDTSDDSIKDVRLPLMPVQYSKITLNNKSEQYLKELQKMDEKQSMDWILKATYGSSEEHNRTEEQKVEKENNNVKDKDEHLEPSVKANMKTLWEKVKGYSIPLKDQSNAEVHTSPTRRNGDDDAEFMDGHGKVRFNIPEESKPYEFWSMRKKFE